MSAGGGKGHWLDRLAVAHTRRHAFKATIAATAITLPLVRSRRASAAEDLHACRKGCIYASHREGLSDYSHCIRPLAGPLFETLFIGSYIGLAKLIENEATEIICSDKAMLAQRERDELCNANGCPGFDPASEWGPCKNCATIPGCQCCPDASAPTGYTYCSSLSNYCCGPNGGCVVCGT